MAHVLMRLFIFRLSVTRVKARLTVSSTIIQNNIKIHYWVIMQLSISSWGCGYCMPLSYSRLGECPCPPRWLCLIAVYMPDSNIGPSGATVSFPCHLSRGTLRSGHGGPLLLSHLF